LKFQFWRVIRNLINPKRKYIYTLLLVPICVTLGRKLKKKKRLAVKAELLPEAKSGWRKNSDNGWKIDAVSRVTDPSSSPSSPARQTWDAYSCRYTDRSSSWQQIPEFKQTFSVYAARGVASQDDNETKSMMEKRKLAWLRTFDPPYDDTQPPYTTSLRSYVTAARSLFSTASPRRQG